MDLERNHQPNDFVSHGPPTPVDTSTHNVAVHSTHAPAASVQDTPPAATTATAVAPMPVVQVLSPRGVEYVFLTINLFAVAIGLISVLIALVNGKTDFNVLAFPVAVLVVSVPLFALLFLRLKKAELRDSSLRADASKRRSTQFTQVVAYLVVFFSLIGLVSAGFAKASGDYTGNFLKLCLDVLILVVVAGGILAYYWRDEHRAVR